jgi:hypothetical protein
MNFICVAKTKSVAETKKPHRAALPDQDLAGVRALAAVGLDAEALRVGIAAVA